MRNATSQFLDTIFPLQKKSIKNSTNQLKQQQQQQCLGQECSESIGFSFQNKDSPIKIDCHSISTTTTTTTTESLSSSLPCSSSNKIVKLPCVSNKTVEESKKKMKDKIGGKRKREIFPSDLHGSCEKEDSSQVICNLDSDIVEEIVNTYPSNDDFQNNMTNLESHGSIITKNEKQNDLSISQSVQNQCSTTHPISYDEKKNEGNGINSALDSLEGLDLFHDDHYEKNENTNDNNWRITNLYRSDDESEDKTNFFNSHYLTATVNISAEKDSDIFDQLKPFLHFQQWYHSPNSDQSKSPLLSKTFYHHLKPSAGYDTVLITGNDIYFFVHSCIICRSQYLYKMLLRSYDHKANKYIMDLSNISKNQKAIQHYIYSMLMVLYARSESSCISSILSIQEIESNDDIQDTPLSNSHTNNYHYHQKIKNVEQNVRNARIENISQAASIKALSSIFKFKKFCSAFQIDEIEKWCDYQLTKYVDHKSVFYLLDHDQTTDTLNEYCKEYIAKHLNDFILLEQFEKLPKEMILQICQFHFLNKQSQDLTNIKYGKNFKKGKSEYKSMKEITVSHISLPELLTRHLRTTRRTYPSLFDVLIESQDNMVVRAHRLVISARSEYFRAMLRFIDADENHHRPHLLQIPNDCNDSERRKYCRISLQNVESKTLSLLLHHLYGNEIGITRKSEAIKLLMNLTIIADMMVLDSLRSKCISQLQKMISFHTAFSILWFLVSIDMHKDSIMQNIKQNCVEFLNKEQMKRFIQKCKQHGNEMTADLASYLEEYLRKQKREERKLMGPNKKKKSYY